MSAAYTDASQVYSRLGDLLPHAAIDHSVAYVVGKIHTNGVESFWSLLKRGMIGSYHKLSAKHLQRYVDEYCWRSNQAGSSLDKLLAATAKSRQLTYEKLTAEAEEGVTPLKD